MNPAARWKKLTVEQLQGAYHAYRILHTSPAITGRGLAVLLDVAEEVAEELKSRAKDEKQVAPPKRKPNEEGTFGALTVDSLGQQPDDPELAGLTVHEASDGDLAHALAARGYDVTLETPLPSAIGRRKARIEKKRQVNAKKGGGR